MPHEEEIPSEELQRLVDLAGDGEQSLIIGTDANAHHTLWGSTDINDRGESLFNYIIQSRLSVANRGEEPTYVGPTSRNVLDITLFTEDNVQVIEWKVLNEPSFSDYKYISFQIDSQYLKSRKVVRNPKQTNWDLYRKILKQRLKKITTIDSYVDLEARLDQLTRALTIAYHIACPPMRKKRRSQPPWWNKELGSKRRYVREIFKLAQLAESEVIWEEYRDILKQYKKDIRNAKRRIFAQV
ncbi:uncharacterized protein LOC119676079 [Teleopsis dalmanni]|uniref:uncharacterized protein LOC119676079 n=1 Tax=Teleopsis dalmanni TaxID=139649 RepID=UPI0018CE5EDC|nr:uncharacterized protein LOC119676079 [Teleopsis dalmanni]